MLSHRVHQYTYWFFRYLQTERGYSSQTVLTTMVVAGLFLAAGYFVGGAVGDYAFKRSPRGRLLVSMGAVLPGAVLLTITPNLPLDTEMLFFILLSVAALFIPFAAPNVVSTIHDVTLPEIRSIGMNQLVRHWPRGWRVQLR
jgi:predicted MFS family arabinose efflux permease